MRKLRKKLKLVFSRIKSYSISLFCFLNPPCAITNSFRRMKKQKKRKEHRKNMKRVKSAETKTIKE